MLLLVSVNLPAPGPGLVLLTGDHTGTVVPQQINVLGQTGLPGLQDLLAAVHQRVHLLHGVTRAHGAEAGLGARPAVHQGGQTVHVLGDGRETPAAHQAGPVRVGDVWSGAAWTFTPTFTLRLRLTSTD